MEVANIAGGDGRAGLLILPLGAAIAWVGINILPGLKNQIDAMAEKNNKSVAIGLGLGAASLLAAQGADAATEVMDLAAGDGRAGLLILPLGAAITWVAINILPGLKNQIDAMAEKNNKSVAIGLGLGAASLLAAQGADAATEVMDLAAGDGRAGLLLLPLGAAITWVGINILPGLKNQIDAMAEKNNAIAAGLGLSAATLLTAQGADAATEIMDLAAGDNRFVPVLGIFTLVLSWVGFNMLQPTLNQLDDMAAKNKK
jgi:photosystem II PsbY protein